MPKDLSTTLNNFKKQRILVIGDLIIDEYKNCQALGKSAESPTIVVKEINTERYIGGAGIIALHLKALGSEPIFISVVGNDQLGKSVFETLDKYKLNSLILFDYNRHTSLKTRFITEGHKLLRLSKLTETQIDKSLEDEILQRIHLVNKKQKLDGIIVSDFNYGVITPNLLNAIKQFATKNEIKLFGDSQTSSQYGDIKKLAGYTLITPNEIEARRALGDNYTDVKALAKKLFKTLKVKNIYVTLGKEGVYAINDKEEVMMPAFPTIALDKMGCGDSMLACSSLALCAGATLKESVFLGSVMAGIKVNTIGNVPIGINELKKGIKKWQKYLN